MWTPLLLCAIPGVLSQVWHMTTAPVVNGSVGEDVVLPCTFTHPQQNTYSGIITVQWLFGLSGAKPFFECKIQNVTQGKLNCSLGSESSQRFFIHEDPKASNLSLLVRNLMLRDNGDYYCRVELDYNKFQRKPPTQLNITAPVRILSLTWDRTVTSSGNGSLCCIAEGNPRPSISWQWSGQEQPSSQQYALEDYQIKSSISYYPQHQYICRADNSLGRAEASFPPKSSYLSGALSAGGLLLLLLLLGVVAVFLLRKREKRPERSDLEEKETDEMELIYSDIQITCPSVQRHPQGSTADEGVTYASVTFS